MAGLTEITIDMSLLQNTVTTMQEQVARLRADMDDIFNQIQELDRMWDGPANEVYNARFAKHHQDMQDMCSTMDSIIDCYDFAQKEYTKCEDEVYAIVSSIKIG